MNGLKTISSFYQNKEILLEKCYENFVSALGFVPKFGVEIEFYLIDKNKSEKLSDDLRIDEFIAAFKRYFACDELVYEIEKERGQGQIEVKIAYSNNLILVAQKIAQIKEIAKNIADKIDLLANFDAQIFDDDCGSALQFNFSLHDFEGKNLFVKKDELFFYSIAGMLDFIDEMMIFCAPNEKDYRRFDVSLNKNLHKNGKFCAPINISCGVDNRTSAVRFFSGNSDQKKYSVEKFFVKDKSQNRIEFRVASSNCEPRLVMSSLLFAVYFAIKNSLKLEDNLLIYGNAFDEQYNLPEFVKNLDGARECFENSRLRQFLVKI